MLSPVHLENNDKPGLRNKVRGLFSSRSPPSPLNVSRSSAPQSSSLINRAKSLRSNTKHSPSLTSSPCSSKSCETSDESFGCVDAIAIQRRQEITGSVEQRQRRIKTRSEPRTDGWREWVPEYACMTCGVRSSDVRRKEDGWYCRTCRPTHIIKLKRSPSGTKICRDCDSPQIDGARLKRGLCRNCRHLTFRHSAPSPAVPGLRTKEVAVSMPIQNVPREMCYVCLENPYVDEKIGLCRECFPGWTGSGFDLMKYELHPRKPEEFAESDYARQSFVGQHPVDIKPPGAGPKTAWDDSTVDRNGGVEVDTAEKLSMEYRKLLPPQDTIF